MIPICRLRLQGLFGLYGPRCLLSPGRLLNLITHSLQIEMEVSYHFTCDNYSNDIKLCYEGH